MQREQWISPRTGEPTVFLSPEGMPIEGEASLLSVWAFLDCAVFLGRSDIGELHACLGIDVQAPRLAPSDELVGAQRYSDHEFALPAQFAFQLLGSQPPLGIGAMQPVRIRHDGLDAREVLEFVPSDADGLRGLLHGVLS